VSKYLITGGLGFLGRHAAAAAKAAGHEVFVIDNCEPTCGASVGIYIGGLHYYVDITDFAALARVVEDVKPDAILHLAAYGRNLNCRDFAKRAVAVNVFGTVNVLTVALAAKVPRVAVCSSNICLSDVDTIYRRTKHLCEVAVEVFAEKGLSVMGLRPSNIYGSGQSRTEYQPCAFAGLDISYERDGHFTITGDGTQSRDFVHADDVAEAFLLAAESKVSGCTFDIATGVQTSMNDVAKLLGVDVKYTDPRPGDAKILVSDIQPAFDHLGFKATRRLVDHIFEAFPAVAAAKQKEAA